MVFGKPLLLTLSKIQWKQIGKQAGWLTKAQSRQCGEAYPEPEERYEDEHSDMQHDQEDIQHEGQIEEPQEKAVSYLWEKKGIENTPLEQIESMVSFTILLLRQGVTSLDSNLMGRAKDYLIKVDKTPNPHLEQIKLLAYFAGGVLTDRFVK